MIIHEFNFIAQSYDMLQKRTEREQSTSLKSINYKLVKPRRNHTIDAQQLKKKNRKSTRERKENAKKKVCGKGR